MKQLFYILCLFSLTASAQVDSTKLYSYNLSIRANDLERSSPLILSSEIYEDLFDVLKTKYRPNPPGGTSLVVLDSVRNDALIGWYTYLMQLQNGASGAWSDRIRTAIKAQASTYVVREVNSIDAQWQAQQTAVANEGKRRYMRQRN